MRGPDFEIPPTEPPAPPSDPATPERSVGRGRRLAALAVLLPVAAVSALVWQSAQGTPTRPRPAVDSAPATGGTAGTSPTASLRRTTTTSRAATVGPTCLESTDNPEAANGWFPDGYPWITFHVSPHVAREALVRIGRHASEARQQFGDAGAFGVRVYCNIEELATASDTAPEDVQRNVTNGEFAYMLHGDMWLYGPAFGRRNAVNLRQTVYHEYFHALQRSLSRARATWTVTEPPLWLIEGSAEFFEHAGTPAELEEFRRVQRRRWESKPALEALERSGGAPSVGGNGDAYTVGALAVDYLVTTYGRERIQTDFWAALADTDWRAAFLHVFGVSVDTFYADFAAYRQTLRP